MRFWRKIFESDFLILVFLSILFFLLNWKAINSYFSQDDFYHLRQVMDINIGNFPKLFLPWNEVGFSFYRPISRELYNFLMLKTFGMNPLPFHMFNVFLIAGNGLVIYTLIGKFIKDKSTQILAVFLYLVSPVHTIELYYLSSVQTLIATLFGLLSILNFIWYLEHRFKKKLLLSMVFFGLAFYSHESSIVIMLILFLLKYRVNKKSFKNFLLSNIKTFAVYGLILVPRIFIHFVTLGLPKQEVYQPSFLLFKIIHTFFWYLIWSFGLPEMLTDFMNLKFSFNPNFFKWYSWYSDLVFPIVLLTIIIIFYLFLVVVKYKEIRNLSALFFSFYVCSLVPFLFFPNHKFVYYLSFPIVFFSILLAIILGPALKVLNTKKIILAVVLFNLTIISLYSGLINELTYWAAKRDKAAQILVKRVQTVVPFTEKSSLIYFRNDPDYPVISEEWGTSSKQAFYILSGSDAFQLFYNDPTLVVVYEDVDNMNKISYPGKVYFVTARFPY